MAIDGYVKILNAFLDNQAGREIISEMVKSRHCSPEILNTVLDQRISRSVIEDMGKTIEEMGYIYDRDYIWETIDHCFFDAVLNPNCSSETLKMILERDNERYARNYYGKINNKEYDGEDGYDYYYERILVDFLNMLSRYAAKNPNCPPETLKMIIKKWKDRELVWEAIMNPSCPVRSINSVFKELKDGKRSWDKSFYCKLVLSPKCPVKILEEILSSDNDEELSRCAAKNPKCPPELLVKRSKS